MAALTDEDRQTIVGVGGKLIEGFRNSPALLALIVLNVIMFAGIFWSVREERHMEFEQEKATQQLLLACQQQKG